jgi:outer membrane protein assembly factor BamB
MRRRNLLKAGSACLGGAVAGYFGVGGLGTSGAVTAGGSPPTVTDTEFEIRDQGCGNGSQRASVRSDESEGRVVVEGVASAPNACYTAELADASYDAESDALTVAVRTFEPEDAGVCAQCLTSIEYTATVAFENGLPGKVSVRHDETTVNEVGTAASAWPQFAFDAANTARSPVGRGPRDAPTVQWAREGAAGAPAVVDGSAYAGSPDGVVRAVDAERGSERWTVDTDDRVLGTPAVRTSAGDGPDTVFAASAGGTVYALDADSGEPRWSQSVDGSVEAPLAVAPEDDGAAAYVATRRRGDEGGTVHALNAGDGSDRWSRDVGGSVPVAPAVGQEIIYAARADGTVLALSRSDGAVRWERSLGESAGDVSAPALDDGTVYVAARVTDGGEAVGRVVALDAETGEPDWTAELAAPAVAHSLALADDAVIAGATAYEGVDLVEENEGGTGDGGDDASGTRGTVHALHPDDGSERWTRRATVGVSAGPTVAGQTAYVPLDGGVTALAVNDGSERWTAALPARLVTPPTPADRRLFVGVDGDRLVSLGRTDDGGDGSDGTTTEGAVTR